MEEVRLIDANALHKRIEMNLHASNPFTIEECCYKDALNSVDTGKMKIFPSGKTGCSTTINTRRMGRHERKTSKIQPRNLKTI